MRHNEGESELKSNNHSCCKLQRLITGLLDQVNDTAVGAGVHVVLRACSTRVDHGGIKLEQPTSSQSNEAQQNMLIQRPQHQSGPHIGHPQI